MTTPDALIIAQANWRDLGPLRVIEAECFSLDAWPLMDLIGVLTFPGIIRYKAVVDGTMVGFIAGDGSRSEQIGWITTVGVLPRYRQMGIGKALLRQCESKMFTPIIQLTVRRSNTAAIQMYKQSGYQEVEIWDHYYNGGEDGILMQKKRLIG